MAKVLTDVDTFDASITVAEDADARDAPSVEVSFQGLANRTKNNNTRHGTNDTLLANAEKFPRLNTVTDFLVPLTAAESTASAGVENWAFSEVYGGYLDTVATGQALVWDVTPYLPPVGSTVDSMTAYVDGGSGSRAAVPGIPPDLELHSFVKATGVRTVESTTPDPATPVGTYEAPHTIPVTGIAHVILADTRYAVMLRSEAGSNSAPGFYRIYALEIGWTPA